MMNIIGKIILGVLCLILLASCKPSAKNDEKEINLGVMASMDYLPLAVAQQEGYFEKVGLNIKLHKFYSANERDAAFQSKSVDGCVIDYTGAILQKSGGVDLKLTSKCDAPFYIVAGKDAEITAIPDLKGKKVAVSQNTVIDFVVDMALKSENLSGSDIEKAEVNKIPVRYELLRNGKIDATGLPNPFALMLKNEGYPVLTSNEELGFAITGIMFHSGVLESSREEIEKLYEAYNMGVDYLASHSAMDIKNILVKDMAFPEEVIGLVELPKYTHAQLPDLKDLQMTSDWLSKRGLVDNSFDCRSLLTDIVRSAGEDK